MQSTRVKICVTLKQREARHRAWYFVSINFPGENQLFLFIDLYVHFYSKADHKAAFLKLSSVIQSCLTLCHPMDAACQTSLSIANSQSLLKLVSTESVMLSNHLILCRPLLLSSILPSIRVSSSESVLHIRWPKYWNFSISPSNEYSGLISFWIGWFDLDFLYRLIKFSICIEVSSRKIPTPAFDIFF